jgi:hypothetical protein
MSNTEELIIGRPLRKRPPIAEATDETGIVPAPISYFRLLPEESCYASPGFHTQADGAPPT